MTNTTINGKAPGHFIINMVTILGEGVRHIALDDISFLCLNDDTLFYDGGSASIGRVRAALFFTEKNDLYTYLLDMFQYGRDIAGRKRKKRKQYLFVEEYEWDAIPTSTALEEAQKEIDAQVKSLQGLGFDLTQSIHIPAAAQAAIIKGIVTSGALLHDLPNWKPGKITSGPLLKASAAFLCLMNIWMDKAFSKAFIANNPVPDFDYIEKHIVDVFKYEALLNGVDFDKGTCTAEGYRWMQEFEATRNKVLPQDFNKHVTFDEFMRLDSNLDKWRFHVINQYTKNYMFTISRNGVTISQKNPSSEKTSNK